MSESNPKRQRNTSTHLLVFQLHVATNVQDLPSDPEILPDVAGCSTTQSDSGNISQSDPEFLPDDTSVLVQTSTCKPVANGAAFPYPSISNLHTRRRRYIEIETAHRVRIVVPEQMNT